MRKIISSVFTGLLVVMVTSGQAQTLKELISVALQENYEILILKNETIIAENNNTAGNAGQLPSVNLNGSATTSFNSSLQKLADGSVRAGDNAQSSNVNLSALVSWTAFDGFRVYAKKEQLGYLQELGEVDMKFYVEQTIADLVEIYYQLHKERELLKSYNQSIEVSEFRLKLQKKRKEVGAGTGMEYEQALVDYRTDSINIIAQHNNIKSLEIEINRILNRDLENSLNLTDTAESQYRFPQKDSLSLISKRSNSAMQAQRLRELIQETNLRIERADRAPKVDLFAGVQYSKSFSEVGFINSSRNLGPLVGVNVSFNLYNGGNTNREIKNAQVYLENEELTKKKVTRDVDAELLTYYYKYQALEEQITLAKQNVVSAEKVNTIATKQLEGGTINGYEFRLTQLTLLNERNVLTQLQYLKRVVEVNIKRLTGSAMEGYL